MTMPHRRRVHVQISMKKCSYCGAEYPDDAVVCAVDQTSLDSPPPSPSSRRLSQTSIGVAITSSLAALLISTGIYCAVGRFSLHIFQIHHPDSIVPSYARDAIVMYPGIGRLLMLGFAVFTFALCFKRCQKRWQAFIAAVVTLGILALPRFLPGALSLVPAFMIGVTMNSSAGYYIGSAFQIGIGAWLLVWFSRRKIQDEKHAA